MEVDLPGKGWVHLDPCEAAVDEPLLYQGWGKNQTYILAFTREGVEDVTHTYTSDAAAAVARRAVGPQEFAALLAEATGVLKGGKGAAGQGGGGGGGGGSKPGRKRGKAASAAAAAAAGDVPAKEANRAKPQRRRGGGGCSKAAAASGGDGR